MTVSAELPRYKCHKEVHALQIGMLQMIDGGALITPTNNRFLPFAVTNEYVQKHNPKEGGYYVVYEDGYLSFSPAEAFESGYALIP